MHALLPLMCLHCDLQPENIMFDRDSCEGVLKIIDFGSSHFVQADEYAYGLFGSVQYCSPEMAAEQGVSQSTDIWSVGVIMYHMLFGRLPFNKSSELETLEYLADRPQAISSEAKECLLAMLHVDCERRPSARQVLQMAWLQRSADCSQYPPQQIALQLLTLPAASHEWRLLFWHVAGHLHGKEANQLLSLFYFIDSNFSGTIEVKVRCGLKSTSSFIIRCASMRKAVPELLELETFLRIGSPDVSSETASDLFKLLDIHNTGIVSRQELFAGVLCASSPSKRCAAMLQVCNALGCDQNGCVQKSPIFDMLKAQKSRTLDAEVLASELGWFDDAYGHVGFDELVHAVFPANNNAKQMNSGQQAQDGAESLYVARCAVPATHVKLQPPLSKCAPATQEEIPMQPALSSFKLPLSCALEDAAVNSASFKVPIKPFGVHKSLVGDTATNYAAAGSTHCSGTSRKFGDNQLPIAVAHTSSDILHVQASSDSLQFHPSSSQNTSIRPFSPTSEQSQNLNSNFGSENAAHPSTVRSTLDHTNAANVHGAFEQDMSLQLAMLAFAQQLNEKPSGEQHKYLRTFRSAPLSDMKLVTDSILTAPSPPADQRTEAWS
eukprot:353299-Chlamydomonas_euryale.AAC.9